MKIFKSIIMKKFLKKKIYNIRNHKKNNIFKKNNK